MVTAIVAAMTTAVACFAFGFLFAGHVVVLCTPLPIFQANTADTLHHQLVHQSSTVDSRLLMANNDTTTGDSSNSSSSSDKAIFKFPVDLLVPNFQMWEVDFVQELFPSPFFRHTNVSKAPGVMWVSHVVHNAVVRGFLSEHPGCIRVLFQTGDEFMGQNVQMNRVSEIYNLVPLVLRQYAFRLPGSFPGLVQVPLGYMIGSFREPRISLHPEDQHEQNNTSHRTVEQRQYHTSVQFAQWSLSKTSKHRDLKWAFLGSGHGKGADDRKKAVETFSTWHPHYTSSENGTVRLGEMMDVYNRTLFVVVGRGFGTLDCFKIYEAIIGGAIPLVVGDEAEIKSTFNYGGHPIPLIRAFSWPEMLQKCQTMTDQQIDTAREELYLWYSRTVSYLKYLVFNQFGLTKNLTSDEMTLAKAFLPPRQ